MRFSTSLNLWRAFGAGLLLIVGSQSAVAQLLPAAHAQAYDFMTVTAIDAPIKKLAKLLLVPAFKGRTEIQLEPVGAFSSATILEQLRQNDEVLTQTLGELSSTGWDLIQVTTVPFSVDKSVTTTRYLFRKAKS